MTSKVSRFGWSLLVSCAILLAGGCQGEGEGEYAFIDPETSVAGEEIIDLYEAQDGFYVSPVLEAPETTTRAALLLEFRPGFEDETVTPEARAVHDDGSEGEWLPVEETFREEVFRTGHADLEVEAAGVRIRFSADQVEGIATLHLAAANPALAAALDQPTAEDASDLEQNEQALSSAEQAALGAQYRSRSDWGARSSRGCSGDVSKYRMAIHMTGSGASVTDAAIRSIQSFHLDGRGWCDVGYHYLVNRNGVVYQGRHISRRGAHVGSQNSGNIGITLVGCYDSNDSYCIGVNNNTGSSPVPSAAIIESTGLLVRVLADSHGIGINRTRILGHREHAGQATTCPGNMIMSRMSNILSIAQAGSTPAPPEPECTTDDACEADEICVDESCETVGCNRVDRIAGANRFATAAKISKEYFGEGADTVIIAVGTDSPDALVAAPLARSLEAPLLLAGPNHLPSETGDEIDRLGATDAVLVGGGGVLGENVEVALGGLGLSTERIAGADRFATAAAVAERMGTEHGLAFVASGRALVDALSAAGPAAELGAPILYVDSDEVPQVTASALNDLGVARTVLVGGTSVVSTAVESSLPGVIRIAGSNRHATAAEVAAFARDKGVDTGRVHLARSDVFADALPAGAVGAALLLSPSDSLADAAGSFVEDSSRGVTLLGGPAALRARVEHEACEASAATPKAYGGSGSCAPVDRIAGENRYATAAEVSKELFPGGAHAAVVAGDEGLVDGLAAGPLARSLGGPVLLTRGDELPNVTADELSRLGVTEVIVVGGEAVISQSVVTEIEALGAGVSRIAGENRWETTALIARQVGASSGLAFIASGHDDSLVDALVGAAAASGLSGPMLLTSSDALPVETREALTELGVTRAVVVGGAGAVTQEVVSELQGLGISVERIAGADRYGTAGSVARFALGEGVDGSDVFVTRGDVLVDALAVAASGRPILLAASDRLTAPSAYHLAFFADRAILVGGASALSTSVEGGACRALSW